MEKSPNMRHNAKKPQRDGFCGVAADLEDAVQLVHELEEVQDLAVL